MLKFFRNIRHNLLLKRQTGKYLKYAFGEIILVVAGILIALQINNWNQTRKQQVLLEQYYNLLLVDYAKNKAYLDTLSISLKEGIASFENYLLEYNKENLETKHFIKELEKLDIESNYILFENPTIQTLEYTGDIKLLPPLLRKKILLVKEDQVKWQIINNSNNEIYVTQQVKALALGLNTTLELRAKNHPQLSINLLKEITPVKLLLEAEAAYSLKYFTENQLLTKASEMKNKIIEIENLIHQALKN